MKANPVLINALRKTVADLRAENSEYNWDNSDTCNCGMLAKNLGFVNTDMQQITVWSGATYTLEQMSKEVCSLTAAPLHRIFHTLKAYGVSHEDIVEIEFCGEFDSYSSWIKRDSVSRRGSENYRDKDYVAHWFEQKANELEAQLNPVKVKEEQKVGVKV